MADDAVDEVERPTGIGPVTKRGGRPGKGWDQVHLDMRRAKVEALELAGASVREIARQVEVDPHTAHDDLKVIRKNRRAEAAGGDISEQRDLELSRLERQRVQLNQMLTQGKGNPLEVHRVLLRVADRKAKLLGLDAPVRISTDIQVGDPLLDLVEEAPKPVTLGDVLSSSELNGSPREIAKVLHLNLPKTG